MPALRHTGLAAGMALAITATASPAGAATIYVSPTGSGNGLSRSVPVRAQTALDRARDGDVIVFLSGSYSSLTLTIKDVGPGVITLRAERPILSGIVSNAASPTNLQGSGAVISSSSGRGLYIKDHDGIVVDGFKFVGSAQELALVNVRNATVSRNHFHEASSMGLLVSGSSTEVQVKANYFTNERSASVGWYMDYGLFAENKGTLYVQDNLISGRFNQGMSLKQNVTYASFAGNTLRCRNGSCLMLGQESDLRYSNGSLLDRTVGRVDVTGNWFADNGYVGVNVGNVEDVAITGNSFARMSNVFFTRYPNKTTTGATLTTIGRLPRSVLFKGNVINDADWVFLEGRGTSGETITLDGNQLVSPLRACQIKKMSAATSVTNEQTSGYPKVVYTNAGLACVYK